MRAVIVLAFSLAVAVAYKRYSGHKVLQVVAANEEQLAAVHNLGESLGFEVDFWREARIVGRETDFAVSPGWMPSVDSYLKSKGITYKVVVDDLSILVDRSYVGVKNYVSKPADPDTFDFTIYHPFADQMAYIQAVAAKYSSFVSIGSIGKSHEGRDVQYLKIGYPSSSPKNGLFIDAGIHAREWIASATALYTIGQLVTDSSHTDLLKAIDIYIAPSVNPDGYEYSRKHDRMWRKTRSGPRSGCYGVDPNRNFPFKWGYSGTSSSPCSEIYRGPSPLSEIECSNLAKFINANNNTFKAYLTVHSYGEDMIYPWGYETNTYPPDVAQLKSLGIAAAAAIQAVHGTQYIVDNSADSLYPAAGASDDYSKSVGVKYVYTIELRPGTGDTDDDDGYGFELPAKYIMPTATETFPGLMVVANKVMTGPF